jgi:CBS-domain-containing membrane protein
MLTLRDIMTADVFTLSEQATLEEAAFRLTEHAVGGAPVRDRLGRLVGVLSKTDLVDPERWAQRRGDGSTVGEAMTPALLALHVSDPAIDAVQLMAADGIHRVIVLDESGRLAGIVTPMDVLRALARGERFDSETRTP